MTILKAFYGSVTAGLGALAVGYADNVLTTQEGIYAAIVFVSALGVIWGVPNTGKDNPSG